MKLSPNRPTPKWPSPKSHVPRSTVLVHLGARMLRIWTTVVRPCFAIQNFVLSTLSYSELHVVFLHDFAREIKRILQISRGLIFTCFLSPLPFYSPVWSLTPIALNTFRLFIFVLIGNN